MGLSFLETTAEIAITFAGFVTISFILARRDGSFPDEFALTMRSILFSSIICLFAAALPLILVALEMSGAAIWRLSSGAFFAASAGLSFFMASNRRRLPAEVKGTLFARVAWSLAMLALFSLAANVAGWPLHPNAGVHLLAIWLFLGISAVNFLDLVLRGVLGGART